MSSNIYTYLGCAMAIIAFTLALVNPPGIGNAQISFHRISIGACHWYGSASFGGTWLTEPWYYVGTAYDDGREFNGSANP